MGSIESHLEVINNTNRAITNTRVYSCANYDWDGNARPDHNFQGRRIPAKGGSISEREELNKQASHCPFNMVLTFSDGTVDEFRIHQKHAIGCCAGFTHMRRSHDIYYSTFGNKLIIKIQNTHQQLQNEKAEEKNREGEAAVRQKQYEAAIQKFDEALSLTNETSTVSSIKNNKSQACTQLGQVSLQEGWDLEGDVTEDKSQEARAKFTKAQDLFQQAQNLLSSSGHQKNLNLVTLKIEGNRLFNEANDLEKEAFGLFQSARSSKISDDYTKAENAYKAAFTKYGEAVKRFEEGAKIDGVKFDDGLKIARDFMRKVQKVIEDVDKAELNDGLGEVSIDEEVKEEKGGEEVKGVNLQEHVDVVIN